MVLRMSIWGLVVSGIPLLVTVAPKGEGDMLLWSSEWLVHVIVLVVVTVYVTTDKKIPYQADNAAVVEDWHHISAFEALQYAIMEASTVGEE